jgi:DNA-binding NtrC family response regulator
VTTSAGFRGTHVREDERGAAVIHHQHRLVVVSGPDKGLERVVAGSRVAIGAAQENDLVLSDPAVSRRHCEIGVREGRYYLRDLGSRNGTIVNDTRVVEAFLAPGARIRCGDSEILFLPTEKSVPLTESQAERFGELVGRAPQMRELFGLLEQIAPSDLSCVLLGETGTGKELAARALHSAGPRAARPLVVIDCGSVRETLIESQLFGHEKGAFTGADRRVAGAFEVADGGTVFLDEIGELPLELQPRLLRVLERKEVTPLGSHAPVPVDVRIVAATHRDVELMVREGRLREDLFYRLAEIVVRIPPLRERLEDLPLLVATLAPSIRVAPAALERLAQHGWPGNVRELRNVLRRATVTAKDGVLRAEDVVLTASSTPEIHGEQPVVDASLPLKEARTKWNEPLEKAYLLDLLQRANDDVEKAAISAGIHPKSFERLLRQHGIARAKKP